MLANYTKAGQKIQKSNPELWKEEQKYFNAKLLVVEIPPNMVKSYARKLERIKNESIRDANTTNSKVRT